MTSFHTLNSMEFSTMTKLFSLLQTNALQISLKLSMEKSLLKLYTKMLPAGKRLAMRSLLLWIQKVNKFGLHGASTGLLLLDMKDLLSIFVSLTFGDSKNKTFLNEKNNERHLIF